MTVAVGECFEKCDDIVFIGIGQPEIADLCTLAVERTVWILQGGLAQIFRRGPEGHSLESGIGLGRGEVNHFAGEGGEVTRVVEVNDRFEVGEIAIVRVSLDEAGQRFFVDVAQSRCFEVTVDAQEITLTVVTRAYVARRKFVLKRV